MVSSDGAQSRLQLVHSEQPAFDLDELPRPRGGVGASLTSVSSRRPLFGLNCGEHVSLIGEVYYAAALDGQNFAHRNR